MKISDTKFQCLAQSCLSSVSRKSRWVCSSSFEAAHSWYGKSGPSSKKSVLRRPPLNSVIECRPAMNFLAALRLERDKTKFFIRERSAANARESGSSRQIRQDDHDPRQRELGSCAAKRRLEASSPVVEINLPEIRSSAAEGTVLDARTNRLSEMSN